MGPICNIMCGKRDVKKIPFVPVHFLLDGPNGSSAFICADMFKYGQIQTSQLKGKIFGSC